MMHKHTICLISNEVRKAAEILRRGGLVAVPTETVYGLAADCLNQFAVEQIYVAKGRPETKPISVLLTGMEMVERVCCNIPRLAYRLAEQFWPGPLTMILPSRGVVPSVVTAGGSTLGVRCPDHSVTLNVIQELGCPLAAPSANLSGQTSPKEVKDVLNGLEGKIDAVIDGGRCMVGVESTIVDLSGTSMRILRQGGLSEKSIWNVVEENG